MSGLRGEVEGEWSRGSGSRLLKLSYNTLPAHRHLSVMDHGSSE